MNLGPDMRSFIAAVANGFARADARMCGMSDGRCGAAQVEDSGQGRPLPPNLAALHESQV